MAILNPINEIKGKIISIQSNQLRHFRCEQSIQKLQAKLSDIEDVLWDCDVYMNDIEDEVLRLNNVIIRQKQEILKIKSEQE